MATQTIQFNSVSLSEIGSGAITAFIYDGTTLTATLASVTEDTTLKGQYTGTVTDEAADTYRLVVKFDGVTISEPEYQVTLAAPTATYIAAMDVATQTTADAILVDTGTTIPDLIGNLSVGSAGISTTAGSYTATTGAETLTYTATEQLDETYHVITNAAGAVDGYYLFNVGPNGVPVEFEWTGYARGNNDVFAIYAYNYGTTSYDQIGTITGTPGTTVQSKVFSTTVAHVGTGANDGLVRFRFVSASCTDIATDRILCTYTVLNSALGYEGAGVWVDEAAGTSTGTTPGVDGLVTNRSDDFDNAQSIAAALGYTAVFPTNGNSITLSATINNFTVGIPGGNWTLALGGQDIGGCDINDADVSGIATGTTPHFHDCSIGTATLPPSILYHCGLASTLTMGSAGTFSLNGCFSGVAGTGTPVIDFGAAVGASQLNMRHYSGGVEIENMATGDTASIEGNGQIVINANCTGGTIAVRGNFRFQDNSGMVNVVPTVPTINQVDSGVAQAGSVNTITLATTASSTNGQYDPGIVTLISGTGAGQSRLIIDYVGATRVAGVDRDWRTPPDTTTSYIITPALNTQSVNEGFATGATSTTITLNSPASTTDQIYTGQMVFLRSGTGQDQARIVTDYNGTTKVATVHKAWETNPDTTTGYMINPLPVVGDLITDTNTNVTTLLSRVTTTVATLWANLTAMITGSGGTAAYTTVAMANAPSGGGGSLSGPYTRTITITDSDTDAVIESAKVRLYRTGETGTELTNVSGVVTFTTVAATWFYSVTASGYTGVNGTIAISADGSSSIELTASTVTPPTAPSLSAIEVLCLDADYVAEAAVDIDFRIVTVPSADVNTSYKGAKKTVESNVSGVARYEGPQGSKIEYKRGAATVWNEVTLDADGVTNVSSFIGGP